MSESPDTRPKVLCIAGSPRRGGNSDALLSAVMEGVREAGGEPVHIIASWADISACRGCNSCATTGKCRLSDGMDAVYAELDAACAVAIATPVFFASVPSSLKALYDRMQPYWARRYVLGEPAPAVKRPGLLVLTAGGGDPFGTDCAVTPTRSAMNVAGVEITDVVVVAADSEGDAARSPEALASAREAGAALLAEARVRGYS